MISFNLKTINICSCHHRGGHGEDKLGRLIRHYHPLERWSHLISNAVLRSKKEQITKVLKDYQDYFVLEGEVPHQVSRDIIKHTLQKISSLVRIGLGLGLELGLVTENTIPIKFLLNLSVNKNTIKNSKI